MLHSSTGPIRCAQGGAPDLYVCTGQRLQRPTPPDTSLDRVPERLQLELEKAIRHRTYQVCTEHAQFSNGWQQLIQQLAEGRPPDLYGVWHRSLHRMLVQLPTVSFILGAICTTTENLLETGKND